MTRGLPTKAITARETPAWTRLNTAYMAASAAVAAGERARQWWRQRRTYSVTVRSDDPVYQDVHDWLLAAIPPERAPRALVARTADGSSHLARESDDEGPRRLHLSYDDRREQTITLAGHRIRISIDRAEDAAVDNGRLRLVPDTITLAATSEAGRDAIITQLRELLARRKETRPPVLWLLNSWGSWQRRADLPLRELDSVVLRAGQMDRIREDLAAFLDSEPEYVRRGIPWHRGYLLHGPPGTGKTSIVKALANHFGLDLWYAPLGDLSKDTSLLNLLAEVRPRSLLLLEDVDVWSFARDRESEHGEVSMSGLLNALDGVATPHGLVTVLTTNHVDVLDEAVTRPGRVDFSEEIGLPDQEQAAGLFRVFYGQDPAGQLHVGGSTADLMETFKRHMHDPAAAEQALGCAS